MPTKLDKTEPSLRGYWHPDRSTRAALARGKRKLTSLKEGAERPHEGGAIPTTTPGDTTMATRTKSATRSRSASASSTSKKRTATSSTSKIPLKKVVGDSLDPKAARVKLRKAIAKGDKRLNFHERTARWEFTPKQAEAVREVLGI